MTWLSHKMITFSAVFTFTHNISFAIASAIGAIVPDLIEGKGFLSVNPFEQQRWRANHRTYSHWFIPYLLTFCICWFIMKENPFLIHPHKNIAVFFKLPKTFSVAWILSAISFGAILHILQDAISGKVPLLNPKRKSFGVRLIPVRSFMEFAVTLLITMGLFFFKR